MPRHARSLIEGQIYHVIARGCARQPIFKDDDDNRAFLLRLQRLIGDSGLELFAYCLMINHVHLALRLPAGSLSTVIQRLLTSYALYFNGRHGRVGHVFQNRFFSKHCAGDRYFLALVRYIHLNPVKGKMAQSAADWPWSSHREYLDPSERGFCRQAEVMDHFAGRRDFGGFVDGCDLGSLPDPGEPLPEELPTTPIPAVLSLDELAATLTAQTGSADWLSPSRKPEAGRVRKRFMALALAAGHPRRGIALKLGVGVSALAMAERRRKGASEVRGASPSVH